MRRITGVIPPSITVFNDDDESINEQKTREHVDWLILNGIDGIAPCGSTGEFIAMTPEERKRVVEMVIDQVDGRIPVYAGTGHYFTRLTMEFSRHAEQAGADGVMVILPYYMAVNKEAAMDHFRQLRKAISLPIIIYNNPWFAGYELAAPELAQLVDEGVVQSVKSAHGDPYRVHELKYLCGDRIQALYGHDYALLEAMLVGADGWLSGLPNVFPRLAKDLWIAAGIEKDIPKAKEAFSQLQPWIHYGMHGKRNGSPHWLSIVKESLTILGRDVGRPRLPLQPLTSVERKDLEKAVQAAIS
ncbi:MAG: dihydrodipicolinate synthase family protein [Candidatus Sumerlaeota bacterium]|nr:dihydrodipicolinate synthase family protein [Candidatus Sumerlaeota bacterium]